MNTQQIIASIMLGLAAGPLSASLVVYNGFDGSPLGLSQSFPASNQGGLSYGSLVTNGGSYERQGGPDSTAILSAAVTETTATDGTYSSDGTVWMSWLYKPAAAEDWNRLLIFNGNSEAAGGESYNLGQFGTRMGIYGPFGEVSSAAGIIDVNTTYFLTAKISYGTVAANDASITLWWNPADNSLGQGLEPTGTAQSSLSMLNQAESRVGIINVNLGGGPGSVFDELRIGSSWQSVSPAIPEPSTYAVFAALIGGCVVMGRRYWHRK